MCKTVLLQTSVVFVHTQLNAKTVLFKKKKNSLE